MWREDRILISFPWQLVVIPHQCMTSYDILSCVMFIIMIRENPTHWLKKTRSRSQFCGDTDKMCTPRPAFWSCEFVCYVNSPGYLCFMLRNGFVSFLASSIANRSPSTLSVHAWIRTTRSHLTLEVVETSVHNNNPLQVLLTRRMRFHQDSKKLIQFLNEW